MERAGERLTVPQTNMTFEDKIIEYQRLKHEKLSLQSDVDRVNEFLSLPGEDPKKNKELEKITRGDDVFISFGEWGAYVDKTALAGILTSKKTKNLTDINKIDSDINKL